MRVIHGCGAETLYIIGVEILKVGRAGVSLVWAFRLCGRFACGSRYS
jgi:hypothetical protein